MTVKHLTQDDLVLYRYQESPDAAAVERHLEACRQCRDEYAALERVLGLVETGLGTSHVPEPAASVRAAGLDERRAADRRRSRRAAAGGCSGARKALGYGLVPQLALAAMIALLLAGSFAHRSRGAAVIARHAGGASAARRGGGGASGQERGTRAAACCSPPWANTCSAPS